MIIGNGKFGESWYTAKLEKMKFGREKDWALGWINIWRYRKVMNILREGDFPLPEQHETV